MKKITITFIASNDNQLVQLISDNGGSIQGEPIIENIEEPAQEPTPEPPVEPTAWAVPAPEIVDLQKAKPQGWNPEDPADAQPAHIKVRVPDFTNAPGALTVTINPGSWPGGGATMNINSLGEGECNMPVNDAEYDVWVQHEHQGSVSVGPSIRIRNHDCDQYGNPA